jgi:hypothetical protein
MIDAMRKWLSVIPVVSALLGAVSMPVFASAANNSLLGCWRSQQAQFVFANGKQRDQGGDCVLRIDATHFRTLCQQAGETRESASTYAVVAPGVLRLTPIGTANAQPAELGYKIDGEWLITSRNFDAPTAGVAERPERMTSLAVREASPACAPRGESKTRIGRTPLSSLALQTPSGWTPWLVDPAGDGAFAAAVNTSFLIGAFVPAGTANPLPSATQWVLVLDDTRYGPSPVRGEEFAAVKLRFANEVGAARLKCDLPDRTCALYRSPEGKLVYTELSYVRGRVVMVSSTTASAGAAQEDALRRAVRTFIDQIQKDNAAPMR